MKILVLSASVGSGHMRAAQAVELALKEAAPSAMVESVDVLKLATPLFRALYRDAYVRLACSAPTLIGYLYRRLDCDGPIHPNLGDHVRQAWQQASLRALRRLLARERWDAVVHTHFLSAELGALFRRQGLVAAPQYVVLTDYEGHRIWVHDPRAYYFVATDDAAHKLRSFGLDDGQIEVSGIPIHPAFTSLASREECRRRRGLAGDRPVVLQLGGGLGICSMDRTFRRLASIGGSIQLVVCAGRNAALKRRLERIRVPQRHDVRILDYTDVMHEWLMSSDLVVTKAGGLTVSEALACGAPLAIVDPIPGQETGNCDFILENGAAIKIAHPSLMAPKIEALLRDPGRLALLRSNAARLAKPSAAALVAARVLQSVATPLLAA